MPHSDINPNNLPSFPIQFLPFIKIFVSNNIGLQQQIRQIFQQLKNFKQKSPYLPNFPMNHYSTPIKQASHLNIHTHTNNARSTKSNMQNKAQDWICIICNNLNFSFRKKCNRCKTQTRIQNQNHIASTYSHYYYDHQYSLTHLKSQLSDVTNLYTPQHKYQEHVGSKKKQLEFENIDVQTHRKPEKDDRNISMSLNLHQNKNKKDPNTALDLDPCLSANKATPLKQSYMNQFWQQINIRDFDDIIIEDKLENQHECQEQNQQESQQQCEARNQERRISADLERMFNKILLQ